MTGPGAELANHSVLALAGPTAAGKSAVALRLAEQLGGEIISVDSMQVYRGMDVGTAKPSPEERARVPHHLIDIVEVGADFDAAQFVRLARRAVEEIRARNRLPILCGGTGLYFKAFFEGLGAAPAGPKELRAELEAMPLSTLLNELAQRDPAAYDRIDRQNPRRVVRALEVIRLTGKPYSEQRAAWAGNDSGPGRSSFFGLVRTPGDLRGRIDARVDAMFTQGLVEETQALLRAGLERSRTAGQALGYRQVIEYLNGARSFPETVALVKTRTRQFAKRQMTWFRGQSSMRWLNVEPDISPEQIAENVRQLFAA